MKLLLILLPLVLFMSCTNSGKSLFTTYKDNVCQGNGKEVQKLNDEDRIIRSNIKQLEDIGKFLSQYERETAKLRYFNKIYTDIDNNGKDSVFCDLKYISDSTDDKVTKVRIAYYSKEIILTFEEVAGKYVLVEVPVLDFSYLFKSKN